MSINKDQLSSGLKIMEAPILPLVKMAQLLYLTGPFETVTDLLAELNEPIETSGIVYDYPAQSLEKYLTPLSIIETLKNPRPPSARVLDENHQTIDPMEAIELLIAQHTLTIELEEINSALCHPCGCRLCCTGPDDELNQDFFEIPLSNNEVGLFNLTVIDSEKSRTHKPSDDHPLSVEGHPFYMGESRIVKWRTGWSMILPRHKNCPALDLHSGGCKIYPARPTVCRRPQIFPYALEHEPDLDIEYEGRVLPTYIKQKKLLAVWDCPYVKILKNEIAQYAEICGLEPIFRENKA